MSPRVMVLGVYGPMATDGTRIDGQPSDDTEVVFGSHSLLRPALARDRGNEVPDVKPWWAISLIGKDPRPNLIELPIFDNRGVHIEGEDGRM